MKKTFIYLNVIGNQPEVFIHMATANGLGLLGTIGTDGCFTFKTATLSNQLNSYRKDLT